MLPPIIVSIQYPLGNHDAKAVERELRKFTDNVADSHERQLVAGWQGDDWRPRRPVTYLQSALDGQVILTAIIG